MLTSSRFAALDIGPTHSCPRSVWRVFPTSARTPKSQSLVIESDTLCWILRLQYRPKDSDPSMMNVFCEKNAEQTSRMLLWYVQASYSREHNRKKKGRHRQALSCLYGTCPTLPRNKSFFVAGASVKVPLLLCTISWKTDSKPFFQRQVFNLCTLNHGTLQKMSKDHPNSFETCTPAFLRTSSPAPSPSSFACALCAPLGSLRPAGAHNPHFRGKYLLSSELKLVC